MISLMISENRVISHLTRKPWVTQAGELLECTAKSAETGAMTIFRNITLPKKNMQARFGMGIGTANEKKKVLFMHWIPLCSLPFSIRDMWTPSENTRKHNPVQRAPSVLPQCAWSTACSSPRGIYTIYISRWSWWNNITASENTTNVWTGITNTINALWGILQ